LDPNLLDLDPQLLILPDPMAAAAAAAEAAAAMQDGAVEVGWARGNQYQFQNYTPRSFPNQHDPIRRRHRMERSALADAKRARYGKGSISSLRSKYENAIGDSTKAVGALRMQNYINNRINDGFVGRGRYRRNMGRGRFRGRGMYTTNAVRNYTGRGSFYENLQKGQRTANKGVRFVAANYGNAAKYAAQGASMFGTPRIMATSSPTTSMGSMLEGRGAYNTLFPELGPEPVQFETADSEHGNLTVSGSEKITDIFGSSLDQNGIVIPYTQFDIPLYPGNFEHFPRLAQHAQNFKEYEFVQLIFIYKSTIPPNWSTTSVTTGKIIMSTQMDVNRPEWTTYDDLYSQENKTEGLVTGMSDADRMHTHGIECDPKYLTTKGLKFVRTKGLPNNVDKKDYDLGRMSFGMFGTSTDIADKMVGELWVQYRVSFKNHRMYTSLGYGIPTTILKNVWPVPQRLWTEMTETATVTDQDWNNTLNFKDSYLLKKCVYNNIDFDASVSTLQVVNPDIATVNEETALSYVWCKVVKLIFPSSLRGDYEISLNITGDNFIPSNESITTTENTAVTQRYLQESNFIPLVTGTAQLNYDIAEGGPYIDSNTMPKDESAFVYAINSNRISLKCHLHLGQAVSTQVNSVSLLVPVTASHLSHDTFILALLAANDTYSDDIRVTSACLSVSQYNAQQQKGVSGFEYT
jgi:hypothetical protein